MHDLCNPCTSERRPLVLDETLVSNRSLRPWEACTKVEDVDAEWEVVIHRRSHLEDHHELWVQNTKSRQENQVVGGPIAKVDLPAGKTLHERKGFVKSTAFLPVDSTAYLTQKMNHIRIIRGG